MVVAGVAPVDDHDPCIFRPRNKFQDSASHSSEEKAPAAALSTPLRRSHRSTEWRVSDGLCNNCPVRRRRCRSCRSIRSRTGATSPTASPLRPWRVSARSWATSASAGQRWPRRACSTRRCWPLRPVRSSWWAQPSRDVAKLASVTELKPTGADAGQQTLITEPVAGEIDSAERADAVEEVTAPVESTPVETARGGSHQNRGHNGG